MQQIELTDLNYDKAYILAISGGVDSMVLLDVVVNQFPDKTRLVVAHLDHGVREGSALDMELVSRACEEYGLKFEHQKLTGEFTDEATMRKLRYDFLEEIRTKNSADAVVTGHHQDDVIETMLINLSRGTNRRGLSSLASSSRLVRPLLGVGKQTIYDYAIKNNIEWHEDPSNDDTNYLRNLLRLRIKEKLSVEDREKLLYANESVGSLNSEIDTILSELANSLPDGGDGIPRNIFVLQSKGVAFELIKVFVERQNIAAEFSQAQLRRAWLFVKISKKNKQMDFGSGVTISLDNEANVIFSINNI